jgi:DNA polymerase (family 10)
MTNSELAQALRDLRDFLIIAGYEEGHATRYTHIARAIEKHPEDVARMRREGRLKEIPGVGPTIQGYIKELLEDGVTSKQRDWESSAPWSVVEMVRVPGLGARTVRTIFNLTGVKSLAELKEAEAAGRLDNVPGVGPALREAIREASLP